MDRKTLEWFEILAKGLVWAAGLVLALSVIGAISIATSSNSLPFFEDVQRESRGIAAIAALGGGLAAAGVLSGLGAILRLLLTEPLARARVEQPLPEELGLARPSQARKAKEPGGGAGVGAADSGGESAGASTAGDPPPAAGGGEGSAGSG